MYRITAVVAIPLLLSLTPSAPQSDLSAQVVTAGESTITVTGSARRVVDCDMVEARFMVTGKGETVEEAKSDHDRRAGSLLAFLEEIGLDHRDYRTSRVTMGENAPYGLRLGEREAGSKYRADQEFVVIVRQLDAWEFILNGVLESGATAVRNVRFRYSAGDSLRSALRLEAAQDARRRAGEIASALGVTIVGVRQATDQSDPWYRQQVDVTATQQSYTVEEMERMAATFSRLPDTTASGTETIEVRMVVSFAIQDQP